MKADGLAVPERLIEWVSSFFDVSPADVRRFVASRERGNSAPSREGRRWQDALIEREIPQGASVLDLGCGRGDLLSRLAASRSVRGQGVELDPGGVEACIARGVPVIQSDLDEGLRDFPDGSFDFVVLEETLQTLRSPMTILAEMLRVGGRGIVSFPNFAFWKVWTDFALRGRMPVTSSLPYRWHDSPNLHLFTFRDFADWTRASGVRLAVVHVRSGEGVRRYGEGDDFRGEEMLAVVEKDRTPSGAERESEER